MNPQDAIINALQNSMNEEPGNILRNKILKSAADGTDTVYIPRQRYTTIRTLLIAAIIASLTITTAFAAGLPGFIRGWYTDTMTVSEYEVGYMPHLDLDDITDNSRFAIITIGDVVVRENENPIRLNLLQEAQDILAAPLLVPTCTENEKEPVVIKEWRTNKRSFVEIDYFNGDVLSYTNGRYVISLKNPGVFRLLQIYVGDEHVTFDLTEGFKETKVNGYEAFWIEGNVNGLYWVQDRILVGLLPLHDISRDQAMKIAESLVPMQ